MQYIVADDLTGASDAGVQSAKRGARTIVWLDYERPVTTCDADVVVVDTDSRAESAATAYDRMTELVRRLAPGSPRDIVKKMDSTLRGNFGAETRAALEAQPGAFALVCPAYPKNGRTVRDGVLFVHGTPVNETDFGRDLFSPVRDARVRAHLPVPVAMFDLATIRGGVGALNRAIDAARSSGIRAAVADAETDEDLRALAAIDATRRDLFWTGSAGIMEHLEHDRPAASSDRLPIAGAVVFLIGSLSAMTQLQIEGFARHAAVEELDPTDVLRGATTVADAVARVRGAVARGNDVLLAMDGERAAVLAALAFGAERGWDVRMTSERLRKALLSAIAPIVTERQGATFVLSGGDIARSFCDAFGIRGMTLLAETAPGIPLSRAIGADMFLVTKAGGFGHPDSYREILSKLKAKVTA